MSWFIDCHFLAKERLVRVQVDLKDFLQNWGFVNNYNALKIIIDLFYQCEKHVARLWFVVSLSKEALVVFLLISTKCRTNIKSGDKVGNDLLSDKQW